MKLTVTEQAAQFYIQEMGLSAGDSLTFYVRVGGVGSGGFSAGIVQGEPDIDYTVTQTAALRFCVTNEDEWYFDGMTIDYDTDKGELLFANPKIDDVTNPL